MMKSLFAGVACAVLASSVAYAADVSAPSAYDWTGGYIGIEGGAAFNQSQWSDPNGVFPNFNTNGTGLAIGGVAGYRYQTGSSLVIGAELSGDWLGVDGQADCQSSIGPFPTCETKQNFLGIGQINLGLAAGNALFYVGGGAAVGSYQYDEFNSLNQSWHGDTRLGWTVGAGVDLAVSQNWTAGLRWNYYDLGTVNEGGGSSPTNVNFGEKGNLVTARIEYKF